MFMLEKGKCATLDYVRSIETPAATDTWRPVSHREVIDAAFKAAEDRNLKFDFQALVRDGKLYGDSGQKPTPVPGGVCFFKLLFQPSEDIKAPEGTRYTLVGMNAHDKSQALEFVAGGQVSVCSNGVRAGEIIVKRKHTSQIDVTSHVGSVFDQFLDQRTILNRMVEELQGRDLTDDKAVNMVVDAADAGAISSSHILPVVREWREPSHEEFRPRNAWSLYNAHTEVMKKQSADRQRDGFRALNQVFVPDLVAA